MRYIVLTLLLMILTHTISAEEITTNNLITNGNFETGNSNGWTTEGDVQVLSDCCTLNNVASNYDLEFGDSGSIAQDFNLSTNTITQNMLDNGITLNSTVEVQNGECNVSGCWGGQGAADTFTITLNIKDKDGNLLATNTTIRTDVTGINGANFTDQLIYTGQNSNIGNLNISGVDANAPSTLGGANLDNISVTMTYDDTVLSAQASTALTNIEEVLEELTAEVFNEIEELYFKEEISFTEEIFAEEIIEMVEMETLPSAVEVMAKEIVEEIIEEIEETIEPPPTMMASMPKEKMVETVEEKAEEIIEEIYEETVSMVSEKEETVKEEEVIEEAAVEEENNEAVEETNVPEKEQAEKESEVEAQEEEESNSEESTTEVVSTTNNTKQKNIRQKKNINIDKVMAKVDEAIKDIDKNLQVKNLIKLEVMTNDQVSLTGYATIPFYKSKDIYLNQLNMSDPRLLYTEVTLNKYKVNDPVFKKQELLHNIKLKKQKLLIELEQLKNG